MKLNKILIFLICFFSFEIYVKAVDMENLPIKEIEIDESPELKYDVEKMEFSANAIKLTGWARKAANNDYDHNIGGENLKIYIAAISQDYRDDKGIIVEEGKKGFLKNIDSVKNAIISGDVTSAGLKQDYNYIVKESEKYENGNILFSSLCYKTYGCSIAGSGMGCCEKPASYTKDIFKHNGGEIKKSTCINVDSNSTVTCESYNTGFFVEFSLEDLEMGFEGVENLNVEFLIFISHRPVIEVGFNTINGYILKYKESLTNSVYYKKMAVAEQNCENCDILKVLYNLGVKLSDKFIISEPNYLVTSFVNEKRDTTPGHHFNKYRNTHQGEKTYKILSSKKEQTPEFNNDVGSDGKLNMYQLEVCANKDNITYLPSGDGLTKNAGCEVTHDYWAWSTWGKVYGSTVLSIKKNNSIPDVSCQPLSVEDSCDDSYNEKKSCNALIEGNKLDGYVSLGGDSYQTKLIVKFLYEKSEEIDIIPSWPKKAIKKGTVLEFGLNVKKTYSFKTEKDGENDKIGYYYELIINTPKGDFRNYITKLELKNLIDLKVLSGIKMEDIIEKENELKDEIKMNENAPIISYSNFFDSNNYDNYVSDVEKMLDISYGVENSVKDTSISFKKSCIKKTDATVSYVDGDCSEEYITAPNIGYFIPFNIENQINNKLPMIQFKFDEDIINNVKYEFCELKFDDMSYKYRVIDLNDPFPNVQDNDYPSNWKEFLENSSYKEKVLYYRYKDTNKEYYKAYLSTDNINLIRDNNNNKLNKKYLDVGLSEEKTLINDNKIFSSKNTNDKLSIGYGKKNVEVN